MYNTLKELDFFKKLNLDGQSRCIKHLFGDFGKDLLAEQKVYKPKFKISDLAHNYFGIDETCSVGRKILSFILVQLPEFPTYFIPAFTQSKNTGDAKDLKKGEGPRGLITGGLEGLAVGTIVSGHKINVVKELIPYICIGSGLQFLSSVIFPRLGENLGSLLYKKKLTEPDLNTTKNIPNKPTQNLVTKKLQTPYANAQNNSSLKV